jgi:hypothetical protein
MDSGLSVASERGALFRFKVYILLRARCAKAWWLVLVVSVFVREEPTRGPLGEKTGLQTVYRFEVEAGQKRGEGEGEGEGGGEQMTCSRSTGDK